MSATIDCALCVGNEIRLTFIHINFLTLKTSAGILSKTNKKIKLKG